MRKNAFAQGSWYKGNTHTHTTASDGTIKQEEVVRIYRERGYDFLALTEHNTYTDTEKYDTDNFITIPGAEPMLWHNSRETAFTAHVVCIGIPGKLKFTDGQTLEYDTAMNTPDFIKYLKDNGNFTIFAHPSWSRTRLEHFNEYIEGADAIEIYNHECEIVCGQGFGETYFETALWGRKKSMGRGRGRHAPRSRSDRRLCYVQGRIAYQRKHCKRFDLRKFLRFNRRLYRRFLCGRRRGLCFLPGSKADLHIRRYVPRAWP